MPSQEELSVAASSFDEDEEDAACAAMLEELEKAHAHFQRQIDAIVGGLVGVLDALTMPSP